MNRRDRRAIERYRQQRATQIKIDMKQARDRDSRYRYLIFLNGVPAWPDPFKSESLANAVMKKLRLAMAAENPEDPRLDGFEVRPVLPSKAP